MKHYYSQFMYLFTTPLDKLTKSDLLKLRNRFAKRFKASGLKLVFDTKSSPGNVRLYLNSKEGTDNFILNGNIAWVRSYIDGYVSCINGKTKYL